MLKKNFRKKVDELIELSVKIYNILQAHELQLIAQAAIDLDGNAPQGTRHFLRKRILNYLIKYPEPSELKMLWLQYQHLFRALYRDFHVRSSSPLQDDLFTSQDIFQDTLSHAMDEVSFKHIFLQKAYACFGVDFEVIPVVQETCLFSADFQDEAPVAEIIDQTSHSKTCIIM